MAEAAATVVREARGYLPPGANLAGFSIRLNWAMRDQARETILEYAGALDAARQALHPDRAPEIRGRDDALGLLEVSFPLLRKVDHRAVVQDAVADQRQIARDALGPMLARGRADRTAAISMLKARCPILDEIEIAQLVDEQAAKWLFYRHEHGLGAGALKPTKKLETAD
jgi:hypothetical protein